MMKEDSESWFVASCITEEANKSECAGREGCDHDGNHWIVLVGFTESEEAQFRSKEELLHFYVQIVVDTLNMSNAEAKERIYLVSVGVDYGFCVRLEGFALRNKLKESENVMSTAHDCGWSRRDHDPCRVKRKKDLNQEDIAVKASLGLRKSVELNTTFKGTSKSRKIVDNPKTLTEHAKGPLSEIRGYSQLMRSRRSPDCNGWRGRYTQNSSRASQSNMESKRKWSHKSSTFVGHIPMVADAVSVLPPKDHSTDSREEADQVREKLSRVTLDEADRRPLIFEITGVKCYSSSGISPGLQGLENQQEVSSRSSRSPSVSSEDINEVDLLNGFVESSGSASPASVVVGQHPLPGKIEPWSSRDLESYVDIRMLRNDNSSYASLPHFAASRTRVENSMPASSESMVQQQTVSQMYPQLHASHFPNRQLPSPVYMPPSQVYMPPMGVTGGHNYGAPQYKPMPSDTPPWFSRWSNQSGYTLNSQVTVGGGSGFEDSTKMMFKDGNPHILNLRAEPYIPSHVGNASFSCAVTGPPTWFQYPGLYNPYQQATIANPYHMDINV